MEKQETYYYAEFECDNPSACMNGYFSTRRKAQERLDSIKKEVIRDIKENKDDKYYADKLEDCNFEITEIRRGEVPTYALESIDNNFD